MLSVQLGLEKEKSVLSESRFIFFDECFLGVQQWVSMR